MGSVYEIISVFFPAAVPKNLLLLQFLCAIIFAKFQRNKGHVKITENYRLIVFGFTVLSGNLDIRHRPHEA